jgi:hypothetical protein
VLVPFVVSGEGIQIAREARKLKPAEKCEYLSKNVKKIENNKKCLKIC